MSPDPAVVVLSLPELRRRHDANPKFSPEGRLITVCPRQGQRGRDSLIAFLEERGVRCAPCRFLLDCRDIYVVGDCNPDVVDRLLGHWRGRAPRFGEVPAE